MKIGIRREDKSQFEARVPLVPKHVLELKGSDNVEFVVQPSTIRAFSDQQYRQAGADVKEELSECALVLGVKEMPADCFVPGGAYLFFSHTIKAQSYNMPMLAKLMALGCTLIDYEKITDADGRRLIFFGQYAGLAGMIDALWALGRRLAFEGIPSPFAKINQALAYRDLADAKAQIAEVGEEISTKGLPDAICPLVCGFAGYGNVSQGAQEIFDLLNPVTISPQALAGMGPHVRGCCKVVFKEQDLVNRRDDTSEFELSEYYQHPDRYQGCFGQYLDYLHILMNCIYWEEKYPRLVRQPDVKALWSGKQPRLRVLADISCDIGGSIECTVRATDPGDPVYVYNPSTGNTASGVGGDGPVVLAVDTLPCELPIDSSHFFSDKLSPWIPKLAKVDWTEDFATCGLPPELAGATIVYRGELTEPYRYLAEHVTRAN